MFINEKSKFWNFASTFGLGMTAGAVAALLFAPMTGKKMQRKLAATTGKVQEMVVDSVDDVQNVIRKVANI